MSLKAVTIMAGLLLALNLVVTVFNLSSSSRAANAGMDSRQLETDPDFVQAVRSIVDHCKVNFNLARLEC
jgi:hypothetical protein